MKTEFAKRYQYINLKLIECKYEMTNVHEKSSDKFHHSLLAQYATEPPQNYKYLSPVYNTPQMRHPIRWPSFGIVISCP